MRVCFDGVDFSSRSGPNTFATRLAHQLALMGHVVADPDDYDVGLVFIEPTGKLSPNKPSIHRLDGLWTKPDEFLTKNARIKACYDSASAVVFQSEFNGKQVAKWWGFPKKWRIIHNGIDTTPVKELTIPALIELRQRYDAIFACSANWHPQKRLRSNVEMFFHLRKLVPNSCLIVMGANPDHLVADRDVFYSGSHPPEVCLEVFAAANWMIDLEYLGHCPNTVVESLSQGTPVICSTEGGTSELVEGFGIAISETKPYEFELFDYDDPPQIDVTQVKTLPDKAALGKHADIDIRTAAKAYEELMLEVRS